MGAGVWCQQGLGFGMCHSFSGRGQTEGRRCERFDALEAGGNGDGVVQVSEIQTACNNVVVGQPGSNFCSLSAARQAEFAAAHTGQDIVDDRDITFDHWLPSFNAKLDVGGGLLFRFAVSKGISRPDLALFRAGGVIADK